MTKQIHFDTENPHNIIYCDNNQVRHTSTTGYTCPLCVTVGRAAVEMVSFMYYLLESSASISATMQDTVSWPAMKNECSLLQIQLQALMFPLSVIS